MNGLHLIADLYDCQCDAALLRDAGRLETLAAESCLRHGLSIVGRLLHTFQDADGQSAGVTGALVLAESHLAVHTWPEINAVTCDLYVCNFSGDNSPRAEAVLADLLQAFAPRNPAIRRITRGRSPDPQTAASNT